MPEPAILVIPDDRRDPMERRSDAAIAMVAAMMFTSADGDLTLPAKSPHTLCMVYDHGYTAIIPLRGVCGCSELAMLARVSHKRGVVALVKPNGNHNYAYVLLEDGSFIDGSFHLQPDQTFSVG